MDVSSLARAVIVNIDKPMSRPIKCMFNPKEYSFTKGNTWKPGEKPAADVPEFQFGGGKPTTLQMQLFFDTYAERLDVRIAYTDPIWQLMMIDLDLVDTKNLKGRPPTVRFLWGKSWSFDAVIVNMKQQFTLFLDDGTPVRTTIDITFQQVKDERLLPLQNPTSGGLGGERVWRVQAGDTLAWIAYKEYGNAGRWRAIAEANGLTNVRDLVSGTILEIPNV